MRTVEIDNPNIEMQSAKLYKIHKNRYHALNFVTFWPGFLKFVYNILVRHNDSHGTQTPIKCIRTYLFVQTLKKERRWFLVMLEQLAQRRAILGTVG